MSRILFVDALIIPYAARADVTSCDCDAKRAPLNWFSKADYAPAQPDALTQPTTTAAMTGSHRK